MSSIAPSLNETPRTIDEIKAIFAAFDAALPARDALRTRGLALPQSNARATALMAAREYDRQAEESAPIREELGTITAAALRALPPSQWRELNFGFHRMAMAAKGASRD